MIPNAAVQHRGKHFDLLLSRELDVIKRKHKQNLITHEKFERSIRRDIDLTANFKPKKSPITIEENINTLQDKSYSSFRTNTNQNNRPAPVDDFGSQMSPRFYRNCMKGQRLPPIVKINRPKQQTNEFQWITNLPPATVSKDNDTEPFTVVPDELPPIPLPELTPLQKQVHSFLETLPIYKGVHRGYDNFGPSSLYSRRAPIAIR